MNKPRLSILVDLDDNNQPLSAQFGFRDADGTFYPSCHPRDIRGLTPDEILAKDERGFQALKKA